LYSHLSLTFGANQALVFSFNPIAYTNVLPKIKNRCKMLNLHKTVNNKWLVLAVIPVGVEKRKKQNVNYQQQKTLSTINILPFAYQTG